MTIWTEMHLSHKFQPDRYSLRPEIRLCLPVLVLALLITSILSMAQSSTAVAATDALGQVVLRWTAPGDDGYVGRASRYDIRLQPEALGPLDTEAEWQAATPVPFLPVPSSAGMVDSVLVPDMEAGSTHYFALRTYDEVGNESPLSNSPLMVAVEVSCCAGQVGNADGVGSDEPTIGDVSLLIDHLFINQPFIWCAAEADINQSGGIHPEQGPGGDVTIADVAVLIDYLFINLKILPDCL
jgi:hypothetical protein